MSYILNIETATKNCSVAVAKEGQTILCIEMAEKEFSHAEKLHVFIEELLNKISISLKQLSAIAVSQGPGSYTGLRIGVSAAKGLCYALDIPLISVDTLEILAQQVSIERGLIIPMIDARRMEVYSAVFTSKKVKIREVEAQIIDENSFSEYKDRIYFIGDCLEKAKTILTRDNYIFLENYIYPSASEMSQLSFQKFINKQFEDLAYFEPYYLKNFMLTQNKNVAK